MKDEERFLADFAWRFFPSFMSSFSPSIWNQFRDRKFWAQLDLTAYGDMSCVKWRMTVGNLLEWSENLENHFELLQIDFHQSSISAAPERKSFTDGKKKFSIKFTHDSQTQVVFSHSFIYCFFSKPIRPRISDGNSNGFFLEQSLHLLTRFEMVFVFALGVSNNSNYCFISSDRNPSGGSDVVRWVDESHLNL